MSKSTNFSGKPIIKQVISLIDRQMINRTAQKHLSDRYYKKFKTYDHLLTMMFAVISGLNSLRELSNIILACEGKINHIGINNIPQRSTVADANRKRSRKFLLIYIIKYIKDSEEFYRTAVRKQL